MTNIVHDVLFVGFAGIEYFQYFRRINVSTIDAYNAGTNLSAYMGVIKLLPSFVLLI